jgi:hypothetical protein
VPEDRSRLATEVDVIVNRIFKHTAGAALEAGLIALLVVGLIAGSALAAKPSTNSGHKGGGSTGGTSSLSVVMVTDVNGDAAPNWGDTITFKVTTTATYPYVSVTCSQGGTLVYSASAGFYASYPWPGARNMPLSSPSWTGGAADCTAVLNTSLATLKFHVNE